jgi:hypothetical protein
MPNAKRKFRIAASLAALIAALFVATPFVAPTGLRTEQQMPHKMPVPPPSAQEDADKNNAPKSDAQAVRKLQLAQNEKEFREGVERLYQLTGELRDAVQKTPTTAVLSIRMYKKTEEIEKLAKQLKTKAKGG